MDKWQAIDTYWNGFGLPAFNELTVPENIPDGKGGTVSLKDIPFITYQAAIGSLNGPMVLSGSLYWRSNSWAWGMQKATAMQKVMDREIKVDGGYVKFRVPVANSAQPATDAFDPQVRRMIFSVEVEFLTN